MFKKSQLTFKKYNLYLLVLLRLTHPTPGTEPGGRMRCAISSMCSVSGTLDTRPR